VNGEEGEQEAGVMPYYYGGIDLERVNMVFTHFVGSRLFCKYIAASFSHFHSCISEERFHADVWAVAGIVISHCCIIAEVNMCGC